jgi:UDP-3-O-[3-hydroxymyristoyl] glucosamine N-acyltransferase
VPSIICIAGSGGHGTDIADIVAACGFIPAMYDDGHNALARCDQIGDGYYLVGVNDPATKRRLAVGDHPTTVVHPTATVSGTAKLAPGVVIGAGSHVGPYTTLGEHVHLGAGCTITRTTVGAWSTIAPGVNIAGDVTIGDGCLIGVGAVIANLTTIGDWATIGAGAVVVRDVEPCETVVTRDLTATGAHR